MKKFFSLLCATLLVFSASAAPVAKKAEIAKKAVAVEQMQKVQFEKAQIANFDQLSATPALKVINQEAKAPAVLGKKVVKADHNAAPAVSAAPAKAPAAVTEDINVTAVDWYYDDYYYDVYVYAENTTYLFELLESTDGLTYGTTYKYADMYADWVCTLDGEGYPLVKATDATLTVTKDEAGLIHVAATMVLEGVTHVISYDEKPFVPSGVQIPLNGTDLTGKYNSYYNFYLYTAKVGDNEIQLAFDATAEQATYTKDQLIADYCYYASPDYSTYVEFVKAASDFTVNTTEKTKTLTGSIYADNGDEYILNLVYEKPAAKEITLVADTLNFFTKMLNAGYYQMQGYTADSTYAFSFYFISKSLSGNYTEKDMNAYSTWVDQKDGKKTVVSYQNLSAANVTVSLEKDTLYYTGTMTLATNDGQEANITLNLSCPYTQEWGEWEDFAPFDLNTGKYSFSALGVPYTQRNIAVQFRKDNTGLKQYKLAKWGDGMFADPGTGKVDLVITMDGKYNCTITPTVTDMSNYAITDYTTFTGAADVPSTYDPETATFKLAVVYFNPSTFKYYAAAYETFVMDKPITERDTVKVNLEAIMVEEDVNSQTGTHRGWLFEGEDTDTLYIVQVLGTEKYGTFSYAAGTLGQNFYNIIPSSGEGRCLFTEGEVTIVEDEEGVKLTGLLIGQDEKAYVLNWIQPAGRLQYDADAPFDATFAYEDMKASIKEGVIGIYATNAENYTIGLELYADPAATEIPAGVYTISDTQEAGTALQSLGIAGGYLTECFAGTRAASGAINVPCWFMVEGTITLSYDEYGKLKVEVDAKNSYGQPVTALVQYTAPEVTDYYLVGWINGAAYGIEGDIDNFGDYHFVDGKVKATFNELSYVQVKDNNKQIYGTDSYKAPVNVGNALLFKTGTEKIAINGGAEYEYTLTVYEDGTLEIFYEEVTTDLRNAKANVKAAKQIKNGQIVIVRENKEYNILGAAL